MIHHGMQIIFEDKDKRSSSGRANPVGVIICTGRISGYLKGEHTGRSRERIIRI